MCYQIYKYCGPNIQNIFRRSHMLQLCTSNNGFTQSPREVCANPSLNLECLASRVPINHYCKSFLKSVGGRRVCALIAAHRVKAETVHKDLQADPGKSELINFSYQIDDSHRGTWLFRLYILSKNLYASVLGWSAAVSDWDLPSSSPHAAPAMDRGTAASGWHGGAELHPRPLQPDSGIFYIFL